MIIGSSIIGMESVRKYSSVRMDAYHTSGISLTHLKEAPDGYSMIGPNPTADDRANSFKNSLRRFSERFEKTGRNDKAEQSGDDLTSKSDATATGNRITRLYSSEEESLSKIRAQCIHFLIYLLFGKRVDEDGYSLQDINDNDGNSSEIAYYESTTSEQHYFYEEEQTAFQTQGKVVTADGRELSFDIGFNMSRSFEEAYQIETSSVEARMCDPLVINLDTDVASVSDQKILFDLDADGVNDNISRLNAGSGYLSLDLNDDGMINDGSELFGTRSGDGFRDLSKYDSDGNGWIDEADEIFDKLKICVFDKDGSQKLYKLKEKDVGAIYLGNVNTDFSLNNPYTNKVNAAIRKTGIFLYENGTAGTIQHLDLAREMLA